MERNINVTWGAKEFTQAKAKDSPAKLYGKSKCPSKISIIIPFFNEQARLKNTLTLLKKFSFSAKNVFASEHIYVNDGSSDKTFNVIFHSVAFNSVGINKFNSYKILTYRNNRGKGHAVRLGLKAASYSNIAILDADLSVRPTELIKTLKKFPFDDKEPFAVIGIRKQAKSQPLHRIIAGKAFKALVWLMTGIYSDTQCPYKVLHNVPKSLYKELRTDGFAYDVELILRLKAMGIKLYYQEVPYFNDDRSKVTLKKALKMFSELRKIRKMKKAYALLLTHT